VAAFFVHFVAANKMDPRRRHLKSLIEYNIINQAEIMMILLLEIQRHFIIFLTFIPKFSKIPPLYPLFSHFFMP